MEIYNTTIGNSWQTGRSMQATVLYAGGKQYTGFGREPWSSGYGRQLIFKRSWVGITAPYTGLTFFTLTSLLQFHFICSKNGTTV